MRRVFLVLIIYAVSGFMVCEAQPLPEELTDIVQNGMDSPTVKMSSAVSVNGTAQMAAGNVDGDDEIEIVVLGGYGVDNWKGDSKKIYVLGGNTLAKKYEYTLSNTLGYGVVFSLADTDEDGRSEIFFLDRREDDTKGTVRCLEVNEENILVQKYETGYFSFGSFITPVHFADFDQNGEAEMYIEKYIF
ncbi:MAG: hypothetical protein MI784_16275, partial [Cytophagales bacterium]|nr:hypothetical protein [Cytophagales bacterium]